MKESIIYYREFKVTLVNDKTGDSEDFILDTYCEDYGDAWARVVSLAVEKLKALFPTYTRIESILN